MKEHELARLVRGLCKQEGVELYSPPAHRRSRAGWPDLVMWRHSTMVRELKSDSGRLSRAQIRVLASLGHAGVDVSVWRPADWRSGRIQREIDEV